MENLILKHYKPERLTSYIERFSFGYAKESDFDHFQIPIPFHPWIIPLNNCGFYYNDEFFDQPTVQNINLTSSKYKIPKDSQLLSVRFYPSCFYSFWDLDIKGCMPITDFSLRYQDQDDPSYIENYITQIYDYLETKFSQSRADEVSIIRDLYEYVINSPKESTIESFCDEKKISYMSIYRLFGRILNITPKKFVRLVKFRIANYRIFQTNERLTKVSTNSGYYDQPHFVKEFKDLVGVTPKEYIQIIRQNTTYSSSTFSDFAILNLDL
ncbi:helix-turn-helix transcriptional regulator [Reichenbachiella versicolor]|uniref:helix-turn-helix transcriptional regulator n=1 Tax=Reichenbachiella versicolor TaxID=1821036 RepID=UPI000D6E5FDD|nr:helix-turn-helix transcriptional regulator [Reichenbachiella versicolor]